MRNGAGRVNNLSILAILPVKNLSQAKSRLSAEMSQQQRGSLALNLLCRTLGILKSSQCIDDILIVSRDDRIQAMAERERVQFLQEEGTDLNQALEQATKWSINQHFSAILILPLDLPFLTKEDINSIIRMGKKEKEIVITAPDRKMRGTNALLVKPPGILRYQFGRESFRRHWQQTQDRHIENRIYYSTRIGFDVDSPSQYRTMAKKEGQESNLCLRM
jgi:2-phospho-L-lactate guanylyltransferase